MKKTKPLPKELSLLEELISSPEIAEVVSPLSDAATNLVAGYMEASLVGKKKKLVSALKRMILESTIVWGHPEAGAVLKFNEEIAAKII